MCHRDAFPRLVSGIKLSWRRLGISSVLPALDQAACQLCKQRQGFCYNKPLACRRTPVLLAFLVLSAFSHGWELSPQPCSSAVGGNPLWYFSARYSYPSPGPEIKATWVWDAF